MGLTSGFSEITETSSAHLDEMNFLFFFFVKHQVSINEKVAFVLIMLNVFVFKL